MVDTVLYVGELTHTRALDDVLLHGSELSQSGAKRAFCGISVHSLSSFKSRTRCEMLLALDRNEVKK
eukprot:4899570-Prymnesium_polylepis.1